MDCELVVRNCGSINPSKERGNHHDGPANELDRARDVTETDMCATERVWPFVDKASPFLQDLRFAF
jgi:hypothetical protein